MLRQFFSLMIPIGDSIHFAPPIGRQKPPDMFYATINDPGPSSTCAPFVRQRLERSVEARLKHGSVSPLILLVPRCSYDDGTFTRTLTMN